MRVALGISYRGTGYSGWQSQPHRNTVQDHLEDALERFAVERLSTLPAGRTDAGVHGLMQVVHFDTTRDRTDNAWVRGTNTFLPPGIAVQWARAVPNDFHARASATARRYAYVLLESPVRPSVEAGQVGWVFRPLDGDAMRSAAQHLLGEHDFTSFRAAACQAPTPVKTLIRADVSVRDAVRGNGRYWRFEFEANAFLHHMIRNIMGCLVRVGHGHERPEWLQQVIAGRSRDAAAPTFAPDGLYFLGPVYDKAWGLPTQVPAYDWLP